MKVGILLKSNRVASTLLLILAMTGFQKFQRVHSLPIRKVISQSEIDHVARHREGEEIRKPSGRWRRDIGLVGDNETAAGVIYHVNQRELAKLQQL